MQIFPDGPGTPSSAFKQNIWELEKKEKRYPVFEKKNPGGYLDTLCEEIQKWKISEFSRFSSGNDSNKEILSWFFFFG